MNKEERKHRLALTLLVAGIIFVFMFITTLVTTIVGYVMVKTGVVSIVDKDAFSPTKMIALMSVNSLVTGAIVSAIASKFPLKPVNKIVNQMNRLASGDFKARLEFGKPLNRHPTAIEVSDSFNKMAQELENTEMLCGDFINNFSHEFKTPIVSIAGFAKLLKRGNLTEEQKSEYIDIIEEESMRLAAMATNVLNLTKYENQTILTDITTFNLSEQLRSSILALEGKWSKKNIDFSLDLGEYMIQGNKDMLKHVWLNLIDNAVKFSYEGGKVEISIADRGEDYCVSVLNYGSEITPEQKKRIFNKFYQADESHASEGNGIGLALVKGVTELHGGSVNAECENKTTVFSVILPKHQ